MYGIAKWLIERKLNPVCLSGSMRITQHQLYHRFGSKPEQRAAQTAYCLQTA